MSETNSTGKNPDERGEESSDTLRCSQLTDKAEVVGLDTTDYGDKRIQPVSRLSVATLKLQVELLETLGWDTVDVLAVEPKEGQPTEHAAVAFRPPADGWFTEQAAVAAAPKSQPHGETIFDPGDDEEDDEIVTDGGQTEEEPRWRFEWSNIRDGCGVFVR